LICLKIIWISWELHQGIYNRSNNVLPILFLVIIRYFFELLSYFAKEERDQAQLRLMATAQGYELFYEYCRKVVKGNGNK
jgi:hypothetical protein